MFSSEFSEIFKNNFLNRTLRVTVSGILWLTKHELILSR